MCDVYRIPLNRLVCFLLGRQKYGHPNAVVPKLYAVTHPFQEFANPADPYLNFVWQSVNISLIFGLFKVFIGEVSLTNGCQELFFWRLI